jgi:hypothetical protein
LKPNIFVIAARFAMTSRAMVFALFVRSPRRPEKSGADLDPPIAGRQSFLKRFGGLTFSK